MEENTNTLIAYVLGAWKWLKATMFLLGLVYSYQFAKINFGDGVIAYDTELSEHLKPNMANVKKALKIMDDIDKKTYERKE